MKMMTIAVSVVFKVTHRGDQSSPSKIVHKGVEATWSLRNGDLTAIDK